jgi:SAM-dependent methyltransferase
VWLRGVATRVGRAAILAAGFMAGAGGAQESVGAPPALPAPDVRYEPSEMDVVQAMLRLADVKPGDVVYDLGCGDGRIVIAAVRQANARGVCVDIDPPAHCREPGERPAGRRHRPHPVCERGPDSCASSSPAPASSRIGTTWATGSHSRPC